MDKRTHDFDIFCHPLFIRGNFILCDKIKCIGHLVTGPVEESILTEAGINSKLMAMPTHQELEIRSFVECTSNSTMPSAPTTMTAEMLLQASRQSSLIQKAQSSFLHQMQLHQVGAQQVLHQQQVTDSTAVNHMLLTSLNKNGEEEHLMKEELQRFTQEELLRQEVAKALQQKNQQILFASLNKNWEEELCIKVLEEELQRLTQEKSLRQNVANAIQQCQQQQQQQQACL